MAAWLDQPPEPSCRHRKLATCTSHGHLQDRFAFPLSESAEEYSLSDNWLNTVQLRGAAALCRLAGENMAPREDGSTVECSISPHAEKNGMTRRQLIVAALCDFSSSSSLRCETQPATMVRTLHNCFAKSQAMGHASIIGVPGLEVLSASGRYPDRGSTTS
jgi:hypothetical protein